jgi:hypothetical protein
MTTLSPPEIYGLIRRHGGTPPQAVMFTSIVLAESGGRTEAVGPVGERGIFQIYLKAHPDVTVAQAVDPEQSAEAAKRISSGWTNTRPWSTANNGSNKKYLSTAQSAAPAGEQQAAAGLVVQAGGGLAGSTIGNVAGALAGSPLSVLTGTLNPFSGLADIAKVFAAFFGAITNAQFWKRIGIGALGVGLVIVAIMVFTDTSPGDVVEAGSKAAGGAAVAAA